MSRRRYPPDPRYAGIRVDVNFFHDTMEVSERMAADALMLLAEEQRLLLGVPHTVRREMAHPNTPLRSRERAAELTYTLDTGMGNAARRRAVELVMQGNAQPGKHESDASHLYDSALWECAFFVTCDKRLLKKDPEVAAVLDDLWVVKPSQLLALYHEYVALECDPPRSRV